MAKKPEPEKGKRPDYVARARQAEGSEFYVSLGAAWVTEINGKKAVSVKLHCVPVDWDGSFLLMEPLDDK